MTSHTLEGISLTIRRIAAVFLALLIVLGALPGMLSPAQAKPSEDGCPKGSGGKHLWSNGIYQEPWCETPGGYNYTCRFCNKTVFEKTAPALGHKWGAWKTVKEPTCAKEGTQRRVCSRCGKKETQSIPPTYKHNWKWKTVKEPTCGAEGLRQQVCSVCKLTNKSESIPATGKHKFGKWKVTKEAECTKAGKKTHTCKVCGFKESEKIPATGHDWDEGVIIKEPAVESGYLINGEILYTCKNNSSHTKTKTIKPKPSLHLTMECASEELGHDITPFESEHNYYVYTNDTVTNTGNVCLRAEFWNGVVNSGTYYAYLDPGESYTFTNVKHRVAHFSFESGETIWDNIHYTPEDPDHIGYVTATDCYIGCAPAEAVGELCGQVCWSNTASVTVYLKGKATETSPALSLVKNVANPPADSGIFKVDEQIDWSLTAANTTEDPITGVTVTDKGATVGSFSEIGPSESIACSVPSHTVTGYDAVVGYVCNSATATGTDADGVTHTWASNVATAYTKKLEDDEDPLGPVYGLNVAARLTKEEAHGPANGEYYELNEQIDYVITVENTGETELRDLILTDSLAGFEPIDTAEVLAPGGKLSFSYAHTVTEEDLAAHWVVNSAVLTYTFGDGIPGTPRFTNRVYSRAGDGEWPLPEGSFDPALLQRDECCSLTLDVLGSTEAAYTLHACADHLSVLKAVEEAPGKAAEIWLSEMDKLYELLYAAADDVAKCALIEQRAMFLAYMNAFDAAMGENASADALRLECARLCGIVRTAPDTLPGSLLGEHEKLSGSPAYETSSRETGALNGSDCTVTERYDARGAGALADTLALLNTVDSFDKAFTTGRVFWQMALDDTVRPLYKAADEAQQKLIATWRILLDRRASADGALLGILYQQNYRTIAEAVMDLYKDAALNAANLKP